jgi:polyisoprenoid-binding protein YceI
MGSTADTKRRDLFRLWSYPMLLRSLAVLAALAFAGSAWADDEFKLTPQNTKVSFVGTKANGRHDGGFKNVKGTASVKEGDAATAVIKVDIDVRTIYTDTDKLTNHLKSADFFNVNRNPMAKFVSSKVTKKDDGGYEVTGKLTMNGVTKEITFPATIEATSTNFTLDSTFDLNRHDWKISYGRGQINDQVNMTIKVVAKK